MNITGIAAEYNPFHKGHLHHINECRRAVGPDSAVVCVISGNFVQRGDVAVFDKHSRAEAAVRCGADLVFELPLPWALSSAEGFARGAVGLLGALGIVTHFNFGSECGDLETLSTVAMTMLEPSFVDKMKDVMDQEPVSYAAARQIVLERELGETAAIIEKPNNILAVEYLRALYDLRLDLKAVTTQRIGAEHDQPGRGDYNSGSELRGMLASGDDISRLVPEEAWRVYSRELRRGRGPVTIAALELALLSRLRLMSETAFERAPGGASEGLFRRLCKAARVEPTLDAVLSAAKTKRYPLSRLRRMAICVSLGLTSGMAAGTPPYARLLAANQTGCELLRDIQKKSHIPVITKPATAKELPRDSRELFALESAATDFFVLGYTAREERRGGSDYTTSPVIL